VHLFERAGDYDRHGDSYDQAIARALHQKPVLIGPPLTVLVSTPIT
jgi:hypothetical protein